MFLHVAPGEGSQTVNSWLDFEVTEYTQTKVPSNSDLDLVKQQHLGKNDLMYLSLGATSLF